MKGIHDSMATPTSLICEEKRGPSQGVLKTETDHANGGLKEAERLIRR